tara:strand:- start:526 stop:831 length:306 start_codon:yes stop_codon:yes gene_type:complete
MARIITLHYPAVCTDCGSDLPIGTTARYYGRGRIYGIGCHDVPTTPTTPTRYLLAPFATWAQRKRSQVDAESDLVRNDLAHEMAQEDAYHYNATQAFREIR